MATIFTVRCEPASEEQSYRYKYNRYMANSYTSNQLHTTNLGSDFVPHSLIIVCIKGLYYRYSYNP